MNARDYAGAKVNDKLIVRVEFLRALRLWRYADVSTQAADDFHFFGMFEAACLRKSAPAVMLGNTESDVRRIRKVWKRRSKLSLHWNRFTV